jgi:ketosteroid isomerase-like protein
MRSTSEVLAHHFKCFADRDLDGIMADYAADALFFTPDGVLRGPEAIRGVFEKLFSEFAKPGASIASKKRLVERGVRVQRLYRGDARQFLRTRK